MMHSMLRRCKCKHMLNNKITNTMVAGIHSSCVNKIGKEKTYTNKYNLNYSWKRIITASCIFAVSSITIASYNSILPFSLISLDSNGNNNLKFFSTSSSNSNYKSQADKVSIEILNSNDVTKKLRENEESYFLNRLNGVTRYDICQIASNNPIEDDHSEKIIHIPSNDLENIKESDWMFWGIYDGHSGWTTSSKLRELLIKYVCIELYSNKCLNSNDDIDKSISNGFENLDYEIVNNSINKFLKSPNKSSAAQYLSPALSGSCGLLSFYNSATNILKVAVTGDSRAVLGYKDLNGNWHSKALSIDQTGSNPDEVKRMKSEHPGEEKSVIMHGRVLGSLEPTRSFGDARYKWSAEIQKLIANSFFGRSSPPALKSPPYVTAKPVITTQKINPKNGEFLVMASDGLYEFLSNDQVVNLVVKWMEKNNNKLNSETFKNNQQSNSKFAISNVWNNIIGKEDKLNVINSPLKGEAAKSEKKPIRRLNGVNDDNLVVIDDNVSTHIIRNALGGSDEEHVSMLLSIPPPMSRRYRDDLTVTVIFFGEQAKSIKDSKINDVVVNKDATSVKLAAKL